MRPPVPLPRVVPRVSSLLENYVATMPGKFANARFYYKLGPDFVIKPSNEESAPKRQSKGTTLRSAGPKKDALEGGSVLRTSAPWKTLRKGWRSEKREPQEGTSPKREGAPRGHGSQEGRGPEEKRGPRNGPREADDICMSRDPWDGSAGGILMPARRRPCRAGVRRRRRGLGIAAASKRRSSHRGRSRPQSAPPRRGRARP